MALMTRVCALLLLYALNSLLFLPALSNAHSVNVPKCCRRTGVHKCTMPLAGNLPEGPTLAGRCPYSVAGQPEGLISGCTLAAPSRTTFAELRPASVVRARTEARLQVLSQHAWQKRGPPSFVS